MCSKKLLTKFGNARLNKKGYYVITSSKEGNNKKKLHRLIYEDYYNVSLLDNVDVHHIDGDKTNNDINNLELLTHSEHSRKHMLGDRNPMKKEECRLKIAEYRKNAPPRDKSSSIKQSKSLSTTHNSLGLYRVCKIDCKECKKGFRYVYRVLVGNKRIQITSVSLLKLKEKVIDKGYEWSIVDKNKVINILNDEGLSLDELL